MSRIRSIKPQFWVDEDLAHLPPYARLLYIALWNFADDGGVFEYRPERLCAQIFPLDVLHGALTFQDFQSWLDSLESIGKFKRFTDDTEKMFGFLVNFPKHQVIKKPSEHRFATPPVPNGSPLVDYPSSTGSLLVPIGSREEGVGNKEQGIGSREEGVEEEEKLPPLPPDDIFALYQDMCGSPIPGSMVDVLKEAEKEYPTAWFKDAFLEAAKSNARNWKYAEAILQRWAREGKDNGRTPGSNAKRGGDSRRDQGRYNPEDDPYASITTVVNVDTPDDD